MLGAVIRFFEDSHEIADRLLGLGLNVTCDNFAIHHRHLAGNIQPAICFDRARKWELLPACAFAAFSAIALDTHAVCSVTSLKLQDLRAMKRPARSPVEACFQ